jgi:hypothetical protein
MDNSNAVTLILTEAKMNILKDGGLDVDGFLALAKRCMKKNPAKEDLRELRKGLEKNPRLYVVVMDMGEAIRAQLIQKAMDQKAAQLSIEAQTESMRRGLGFEQSPVLEQMLIENIIICWLRLQWTEYQLSGFMGMGSTGMSEVAYWERRLSKAQQRFLRASNSFARVRKLTRSTVQINIASDGGQQVNVAGNIIAEKQ